MVVWARQTVTQVLWALGRPNEDWRGWYRLFRHGRFIEEVINRILLRETLQHVGAEGLYVVGGDGVQVWRDSQTMEGMSWLKCPRIPFGKQASSGRNVW